MPAWTDLSAFGCWKNGVCGAMGGRQQHDALGMRRDALQRHRRCRERQNPHEEHRIDTFQSSVERPRFGEIAARHFHVPWQIGGLRISTQRTDPAASGTQLGHDLAADVPGRSGDENPFHQISPIRASESRPSR